MRICFTGHRELKFKSKHIIDRTKRCLEHEINNFVDKYNFVNFLSGMSTGVDTWAAEIVLELRKTKDCKLTCCIPFVGQEKRWPEETQAKYNQILLSSDEVIYVQRGSYEPWKLLNRNKYMVDNSDLILAVWNGDKSGGTYHCVSYATEKDKPIINIWQKINV